MYRFQNQYLRRSIEYCDVDDIKAEYVAEIKLVIAKCNNNNNNSNGKGGEASHEGECRLFVVLSYILLF